MDSSSKANNIIDLTLDDDDDDDDYGAKHKVPISNRPKGALRSLRFHPYHPPSSQTTLTIPTATAAAAATSAVSATAAKGDNLDGIGSLIDLNRRKPIVFLIDGDNRGDCVKLCAAHPDPVFETVAFYGPRDTQRKWDNIHVIRTIRPYQDAADFEMNLHVTRWIVTKQLVGKTCFVVSADIGVWNLAEILRAHGVRSFILRGMNPLLKVVRSLRARQFKFLEDERLLMD